MNKQTDKQMDSQILYNGFLSREKAFANCLQIDFHGENFHDLR